MIDSEALSPWSQFSSIDFEAAAARLEGIVERTPLIELPFPDKRVRVRAKLENRQVTGAFKARGAWNNISRLSPDQRACGVVCASSGNHGRALAWAARKAGVQATIVMPKDAYANKIEACRAEGAEVLLADTRQVAEEWCAQRTAKGQVLVHPYDMEGTIEGAGTVALEILEQAPKIHGVLTPVGGGGLAAGLSLAMRRALGRRLDIVGVEPEGAPNLQRALAAGEPIKLESITTKVQGLCPPAAGRRNVAICMTTIDDVRTVTDEQVFAAQKTLVRLGETVEPAGAATYAAALAGLPDHCLESHSPDDPFELVLIVSGGNPDPAQLRSFQESA